MELVKRAIAAVIAATATLALSTGVVLAGAWAEAAVRPADGEPPVAGEETELVVTLLQHGVRPVDFGSVTLTLTDAATGNAVDVPASNRGNGEWVATAAFPTEGEWRVAVTHPDLEISRVAPLQVAAAGGLGAAAVIGAAVAGVLLAGAVALWATRRAATGPVARPAGLERAEA
jgi:hypothetical protein